MSQSSLPDTMQTLQKELIRELFDSDVDRLLQVRIRRISLSTSTNTARKSEKTKATLNETRKIGEEPHESTSSRISKRCS